MSISKLIPLPEQQDPNRLHRLYLSREDQDALDAIERRVYEGRDWPADVDLLITIWLRALGNLCRSYTSEHRAEAKVRALYIDIAALQKVLDDLEGVRELARKLSSRISDLMKAEA